MLRLYSPTSEQRTVLENVRWETYVELADGRAGSVPRMTYDSGVLELMSPLRQHENIGRLIGRVLETYTEVREIEIQSVASTTFRRRELQKGFEADEAYYVEHAELIRRKREVDLAVDPPPDVVIEVEITTSAIAKLTLFAAMGIPEVWRHNGQKLQMFTQKDNGYTEVQSSIQIPGLTVSMIENIINRRFDLGENALIREFRSTL